MITQSSWHVLQTRSFQLCCSFPVPMRHRRTLLPHKLMKTHSRILSSTCNFPCSLWQVCWHVPSPMCVCGCVPLSSWRPGFRWVDPSLPGSQLAFDHIWHIISPVGLSRLLTMRENYTTCEGLTKAVKESISMLIFIMEQWVTKGISIREITSCFVYMETVSFLMKWPYNYKGSGGISSSESNWLSSNSELLGKVRLGIYDDLSWAQILQYPFLSTKMIQDDYLP